MKIHKEGYKILLIIFIVLIIINTGIYAIINNSLLFLFSSVSSIILFALTMLFFRLPDRGKPINDNYIYAPADGKIVVIEKTFEEEHYKDERIQVSIFMSALNVHANWVPINGIIKYKNHYPGKFYAAWNPKSSKNNERTSLLIENDSGFSLLIKQIAGIMARRIVTYPKLDQKLAIGDQLGFIKFGSRVDLFLPAGIELRVNLKQKVKGNKTVIGKIP